MALALRDQGFDLPDEAIAAGIANASWPARLQRLTRGPAVSALPGWEIRLDGGHNPAAGAVLAAEARSWAASDRGLGRALHLVCGMLNSKAAEDFLAPLAPHAASLTAIAIPGEPNSLSARDLAEMARKAGHANVSTAPSAEAAFSALAQRESGPKRLLICGSLYLAGHILADHG